MKINFLCVIFLTIFVQFYNCQGGLLNSAFSTTQPPFTSATHPLTPRPLWGNLRAPFPTNSFWTNTILENGDNPVEQLPYFVRVLASGLQVSLPGRTASRTFIITSFISNMAFSSVETPTSRNMLNYDLLSFQFIWNYASATSSMRVPVVRGSPYMTAFYQNLRPVISTTSALLSVNGNGQDGVTTASKFKLVLNNGQTWLLYTVGQQSISLRKAGSSLTATAAFTGPLRLALLADASSETLLDQNKNVIATGGDVSYDVVTGQNGRSDSARIRFSWKREGTGNLLMLALPHHVDSMTSPTNPQATRYRTMKGFMSFVVGNEWILTEPLTSVGFFSKQKITDQRRLSDIRTSLQRDQNISPVAPDPYFFGKQVALMGRHALIADELGESQIANNIRTRMVAQLTPWFRETNSNPLRFDSTWRGIVSSAGIRNPGNDFGQGFYNDHHFHYGYFLYACAALGKENPSFLQTFGPQILALVRDVANPSTSDPFFPVTRNKDWFVGHSWASGLFVFGDSKNQESTSEAVNAYYGLYLLGVAMNNKQMADLGRVMLATEMRSTQKYWHITSNSTIYEPAFAQNKVVGILWSSKVDYSTFFGAAVEFIHGIQLLPFTPISEELLTPDWVREAFPVIATALTRPTPPLDEGWRGFIVMDQAILDRDAAWNAAVNLRRFDDGNSRTNTFYWIASRPNPSQVTVPRSLEQDSQYSGLNKMGYLSNKARDVGEEKLSETFDSLKEKASDTYDSVKEKAFDTKENVKEKMADTYDSIKEKAFDTKESVKEKASDTYDNVKEKMADTYDNVKEKMADTYDNVKEKAFDTKESVKEKASDTYDNVKEKMADTYDNIKEKAFDTKDSVKEKASDAYDSLKEKAFDAKENIKEKAFDAKENVKEKASDLKENAKEKVSDAIENSKETIFPQNKEQDVQAQFEESYYLNKARFRSQPQAKETGQSYENAQQKDSENEINFLRVDLYILAVLTGAIALLAKFFG